MLADALRGRGCTAWSPTATCWSGSCDTRRSCPGRSAPTSSSAPAVVESSAPATPDRAPAVRRSRGAGRAATGRADACRRASRSGWRNVVSQPQRTVLRRRRHRARRRVVRRPRRLRLDRRRRPRALRVARPRSCSRSTRISARGRRSRSVAGDAVAVDGPVGSAQLRAVPRFVDPADVVAQRILLAPMPGTVVARGRRGRRRGRRRPAGAGARGDEDAAHDQRADRRGRHRPRRASAPRWRRATCSPSWSTATDDEENES